MPSKEARVSAGKKRKREASTRSTPETSYETDKIDEENTAACVPAAKKVAYEMGCGCK